MVTRMEQGGREAGLPPERSAGAPDEATGASSEHLRRVLDSAHDAFVSMDAGGFVTDWNRAAEETFGWTRGEAVGRVLADLIVPPGMRDAHWTGLRRFLESGEGPVLGKRLELSAMHREGQEFPIELTISALETDGLVAFHAFVRDVSERHRAEAEREALVEKLASLARTDELTGLWNRRGWDELLRREFARAAREQGHLCVALLDLDGFKPYNDGNGHQAGDDLLRVVAGAWRSCLRATDVLARYGGDEFAVALPAWPLDAALPVIERLRTNVPGGQTCSAGLVAWDGRETAEQLVGRADTALYAAKGGGGACTITAG